MDKDKFFEICSMLIKCILSTYIRTYIHTYIHTYVQGMDKDKFFEIRSMLIKCILSTDMSRHFEVIKNFKTALEAKDVCTLEWQVCVCMHACMYVCICVCMYVYIRMLIKCILSTDMSRHFEVIKTFKTALEAKDVCTLEWQVCVCMYICMYACMCQKL